MENLEKSPIFEASKHLNSPNRVYDKNSVQRSDMATPEYEQTLRRPTADFPAPVAVYNEKHSNYLHQDIPHESQVQYSHSRLLPRATQIGLEDTVSQTRYMVMCTQSNQARKRHTIGAALFSWLILAGYLMLPNTFTSLQSSKTLSGSKGGQLLQSTVQNVKLLPFAGVLFLIGVAVYLDYGTNGVGIMFGSSHTYSCTFKLGMLI